MFVRIYAGMKPLYPALVLVLAFSMSGLGAEEGSWPDPLSFDELIFDSETFLRALPKKTLMLVGKTDEAIARMDDLLRELDPEGVVEFYALPDDATIPLAISMVEPVRPKKLQEKGTGGSADFLVLIGPDGTVLAVYCRSATHREFGISGAASLLKWKFTPCEFNGKPVPLLVSQKVNFEGGSGRTKWAVPPEMAK